MDTEQNLNTGDSSETESKVDIGNQNIEKHDVIEDEDVVENKEQIALDLDKDEVAEDAFTLLMSSDENTNDGDNTNEDVSLFSEHVENPWDPEQKPEPVDISSANIAEDNDSTLPLQKVRISGAARRKFKKLQAANEVANIQASTSTVVSENKRTHSDDNDDSGPSEAKQAKLAGVDDDKVMVAIIPSDFPELLFTTNQLKAVQEAILDLIIEKRKIIETKPRFIRIKKQPGWLELLCANKATFQWLKDVENELKPWEGACIMVVHANQIPHTENLSGKLPGSSHYSNEKILGLIEAQNEGLDVSYWKILHRKEVDSNVDVMFSMDTKSFEKIKNAGFKIGYKFSQVNLHTKSSLAEKAQLQKAKQEQRTQQHKLIVEQTKSGNQRQQGQTWQAKPQQQQGQRWQLGLPKQQGQQRQLGPPKQQGQQRRPQGRQYGQQRPGVGTFKSPSSSSSSSNASASFFGQHSRRTNSNVSRRLHTSEHQFTRPQTNTGLQTLRNIEPSSLASQMRSQLVWENQPFRTYRSPFQQ